MSILRSRDSIHSSDSDHSSASSRIETFVRFTAVRRTLAALWSVGRLAIGLQVQIETSRRRLCQIRCRSMNSGSQVIVQPSLYRTMNTPELQTSSQVCLCLEPREAPAGALTAGSIVVIGARRRFVADAPLACSTFLCAPFWQLGRATGVAPPPWRTS
jgi:hypothetical protein